MENMKINVVSFIIFIFILSNYIFCLVTLFYHSNFIFKFSLIFGFLVIQASHLIVFYFFYYHFGTTVFINVITFTFFEWCIFIFTEITYTVNKNSSTSMLSSVLNKFQICWQPWKYYNSLITALFSTHRNILMNLLVVK